jgi:alanine racemase
MSIIDYLKDLYRPKYQSFNYLEIDQAKLISNLNYLKKRSAQEVMPVLKSNAYGHGIKEIALILQRQRVNYLLVDSFPEYLIARKYFNGKIIIISEMPDKTYNYLNWPKVEVIVYNQEKLRYLSKFGKKLKIHLFVNTGMNREGLNDLNSFISANEKYLNLIHLVGFCSHLACSEQGLQNQYNQKQLNLFWQAYNIIRKYNFKPRLIHLANSAASFYLKDPLLNANRSGLAFYGYNPFEKDSPYYQEAQEKLQAAFKIYSQVVSISDVSANEMVSYKASYITNKKSRIAVIPFGYYEGLKRSWSNHPKLRVRVFHGSKSFMAKVVGTISMNLACLDIGDNKVQIGDRVEIISDNKNELNSIENLANISQQIPYELLVSWPDNLRRIIK